MKDDSQAQTITPGDFSESSPASPLLSGPDDDAEALEPTIVLGRE